MDAQVKIIAELCFSDVLIKEMNSQTTDTVNKIKEKVKFYELPRLPILFFNI